MPGGQSFQERNASFEHMYSPSKAKALFKKHRDINERQELNTARLEWEKKTAVNEIIKGKIIIKKRSDELYAKVRNIEEEHFRKLTELSKKQNEEDDYEGDYDEGFMPSQRRRAAVKDRPNTHQGIRSNKRLRSAFASLVNTDRPVTSYVAEVSIEDLNHNTTVSRPTSATNKPNRVKTPFPVNRQTASAVHFAEHHDNDKENQRNVPTRFSSRSLEPPFTPRKNTLMTRRSRRKSVFALTKAKQKELEIEGYKEENAMFQEELQDKIHTFYGKVEEFKKAYKRSLEPRSTDLPEITDKDVTNTDDITEHNQMSDKFKIKTINPFQNAGRLPVKQDDMNNSDVTTKQNVSDSKALKSSLQSTSKSSLKSPSLKSPSRDSLHSHQSNLSQCNPSYIQTGLEGEKQDDIVHKDTKNRSNNKSAGTSKGSNNTKRIARSTSLISRPSLVSKASQLSNCSTVFLPDNRPITATNERIRKTLSIGTRSNLLGEDISSDEMRKERVKLLYLDAHGQLDEPPELIAKPAPKVTHRKSGLRVNYQLIKEAFDEYTETDQKPDDMLKLVSVAIKLKHEARKKRDVSFIPFIAVRKYAMAWKGITASHHKLNATNLGSNESGTSRVNNEKQPEIST